jgi:hypothetical protein
MLPFNSIARMSPLRLAMAAGGRVNFETGGLKYPDYNITTPDINVTAPMPTEAERIAYFATHDADGNLIIPNEFAPHDTVKATPPHAYNLPNEYSIPRLGAGAIEALATLGSGVMSYLGGGAYGIGKNIASGKYGTPEGIHIGEDAAAKVAQDYTYQPRLQAGQDMLEGIGSAFEASKLPPIGIPELSMLPGMRRMMPTDVQVMHGRTKAAAQGAKQYYGDPVTDYWNAQQNVRKEYPTLGASLKDLAYDVADTSARRKATRPSQQRTMADLAIPDTKFHAMRPSETVPILQILDPKTKLHQWATGSKMDTPGLSSAMKSSYYPELSPDVTVGRWSETLPVEKQDSLQAFFDADAMTRFGNEGSLARANDARRAAETDPNWFWRVSEEWAALPENQGVALPTEYNERAVAANKAMTSMIGGYIKRYAGAADDPLLLEAAKTGNTTIDPDYAHRYDVPRAQTEMARENAGFPSSGTYLPQLEAAKQLREEVANLYANSESTLTQLQDEAQALRDSRTEAGLSNEGISIREQSPELADLMATRDTQAHQLRGLDKTIQKLTAATKQENVSDSILNPIDVGATRKNFPKLLSETDYPGITQMPDEQTLYDVRNATFGESGILDLVKEHYGDEIISGKIPLSQVGNWSLPKVAQKKFAADKVKRDADEREAVIGEQRVKVFSDELRDMGQDFGTATSLELKAGMPDDLILKAGSKATDDLDICLNHGGQRKNGTYLPWYNIAKGKKDENAYSDPANDTQKILRGEQTVSLLSDKETGKVVAAIQYKVNGDTVDVGYVSAKKNNDPIDPKHRNALRDELNAKPNIRSTDSGALSKNKVYDLKSSEGRADAARAVAGLSPTHIEDHLKAYPDTLRFQTIDDVKAMKPLAVTTSPSPLRDRDSVTNLWQERNNIDTDRVLVEEGGDAYEEARNIRNDLTERVFSQVTRPAPYNRIVGELTDANLGAVWNNLNMQNRHIPGFETVLPELIMERPEHMGLQSWSNEELQNLRQYAQDQVAFAQGVIRRTPDSHTNATAILNDPTSSIEEISTVLDELQSYGQNRGVWVDHMTPDEVQEMGTAALDTLDRQVETMVAGAVVHPDRSVERLLQARAQLRNSQPDGPLRHVSEHYREDAIDSIDAELLRMRVNQPQQPIAAPAYVTPRINSYLDRLETDLPTLTEQQFGERVSRIYERAQEQTLNQQQYDILNDRINAMQERVTGREPNVPAQIEAARAETVPHPQQPLVEAVLQSIGQADTLELLLRQNNFIGEHAHTFSLEQVRAMNDAVTQRITELRDAPMQLTGLAPIPEAVQNHIAEMATWTDEGLRRNIRNLEERHPQTVYRDLTDSQAARVLSTLNDEVDNRAGNGMAQGGLVEHEQLFNDIIGVMHGTR